MMIISYEIWARSVQPFFILKTNSSFLRNGKKNKTFIKSFENCWKKNNILIVMPFPRYEFKETELLSKL